MRTCRRAGAPRLQNLVVREINHKQCVRIFNDLEKLCIICAEAQVLHASARYSDSESFLRLGINHPQLWRSIVTNVCFAIRWIEGQEIRRCWKGNLADEFQFGAIN